MIDAIGKEYRLGAILAYANGGSKSGSMKLYVIQKLNEDKGTIRASEIKQEMVDRVPVGPHYLCMTWDKKEHITTLGDPRRGVILPDGYVNLIHETKEGVITF